LESQQQARRENQVDQGIDAEVEDKIKDHPHPLMVVVYRELSKLARPPLEIFAKITTQTTISSLHEKRGSNS
jgi:hypothetical protein